MTEGLSTVGLGAIIGAALCYMLEERPPGALVIAAAALGGVLASAGPASGSPVEFLGRYAQ
jgi:hypothetical protein